MSHKKDDRTYVLISMHAQQPSMIKSMNLSMSFLCVASGEGSGETVRLHRLV